MAFTRWWGCFSFLKSLGVLKILIAGVACWLSSCAITVRLVSRAYYCQVVVILQRSFRQLIQRCVTRIIPPQPFQEYSFPMSPANFRTIEKLYKWEEFLIRKVTYCLVIHRSIVDLGKFGPAPPSQFQAAAYDMEPVYDRRRRKIYRNLSRREMLRK